MHGNHIAVKALLLSVVAAAVGKRPDYGHKKTKTEFFL
jgi:hypothetical protein